jgi:hypothetical protein
VITNIPTAEDLNNVALRLYFSAWTALIAIQPAFDERYPLRSDDPHDVLSSQDHETEWAKEWAEHVAQEWKEYLVACQPELQSICSMISHSNELALKARICEVSPFLLLIGGDFKFSKSKRDVDFSDLHTIDAVDLPGAASYNEIRSLRNKIAHLGQPGTSFHPDQMIGIMVAQYCELWKGRAWLEDRVHFESLVPQLLDDKYVTEHAIVMVELPQVYKKLSPAQFKSLFSYSKGTRRYLCHSCISSATTRAGGPDLHECKTAFLHKSGTFVHCVMCGKDYKVSRNKCRKPDCKGSVIGDNEDDHVGQCHTCGEWA